MLTYPVGTVLSIFTSILCMVFLNYSSSSASVVEYNFLSSSLTPVFAKAAALLIAWANAFSLEVTLLESHFVFPTTLGGEP